MGYSAAPKDIRSEVWDIVQHPKISGQRYMRYSAAPKDIRSEVWDIVQHPKISGQRYGI